MAFIFAATDSTNGIELWISDGTATGTTLLKNIAAGSAASIPLSFYGFGGKIFFTANDGTNGREVWVTDGTAAGTHILKNINPAIGAGSEPDPFLPYYSFSTLNNKLYFGADGGTNVNGLWVTDGTEAGTQLVKSFGAGTAGGAPITLVTLGNKILFVVKGDDAGLEVWQSDGTTAGTTLLKDIYSGPNGYGASYLVVSGNKAYFAVHDSTNGGELWVTDGTPGGTHLVADVYAGPSGGYAIHPDQVTPYKNGVLFSHLTYDIANNESIARQVFFTDGSSVVQLTNFAKTERTSNPSEFTAVGDKMVFSADSLAWGRELWITDGTSSGTKLLKNIETANADQGNSNPQYLVSMGSKVIFQATETTHGKELWVTDGTLAGTQLLKDIRQGSAGSDPTNLALIGGKVYFQATNSGGDRELWVTDGTAVGTVLVKDIDQTGSSNPFGFTGFPNTAPTNIALSKTTVREFGATGTDVGTLSATDSSGGPFTYTLLNSAGGRFKITGNVLEVSNGLLCDFEQDASHTVQVRVTDSGGLSFTRSFNLTLTNVNPEVITGNSLANTLWGGALNDRFDGAGGNDVLRGYNGNDTLNGGLGNDTLTGGANNDAFVFNTTLSSSSNKDVITDFGTTSTNNDTIKLDNADFTKLIQSSSAAGVTLLAKYFTKNATGAATSLDHRIIYETDTGLLRYDADGNKAGGAASIIFADLAGNLALSRADFLII